MRYVKSNKLKLLAAAGVMLMMMLLLWTGSFAKSLTTDQGITSTQQELVLLANAPTPTPTPVFTLTPTPCVTPTPTPVVPADWPSGPTPTPALTPDKVCVDVSNPTDISVKAGSIKEIESITNGTEVLVPGVDYSVKQGTEAGGFGWSVSYCLVKIDSQYLKNYFTKYPDQNLCLHFNYIYSQKVRYLTFTAYTGDTPHAGPVYGDVNGDGNINSTDISLMRRAILGINSLNGTACIAGDLNGDGTVNSTDYSILKRYMLGIIMEIPVKGNKI